MKPRNFPARVMRRQIRAYQRLFVDGVLHKQSHEAFVLHGLVPRGYVEHPTDIRIRIGKAARHDV